MSKIKEYLPTNAYMTFTEIKANYLLQGGNRDYADYVAFQAITPFFEKTSEGLVVNDKDFEDKSLVSIGLEFKEPKIVMNGDTEEVLIEAIMADTTPNSEGQYFTETELSIIANQINSEGSTLPDEGHSVLKSLVKRFGSNYEAIKAKIKEEKGIFNTIKAVVKDGKLWFQAFLDKKYKDIVSKYKGISIEVLGDKNEAGRVMSPKYLGFTLTNTPKLRAAQIARVV